jgi:hypothetical protein
MDMEDLDVIEIREENEDISEGKEEKEAFSSIIIVTEECQHRSSSMMLTESSSSTFYIDKSFCYKLFRLQVQAMKNQYQMACLSTLGGKLT